MRHIRLAFDNRFWEMAEDIVADLPGEEDEGFCEPPCFQDLVEIELPGEDASVLFFPDADFPPEPPTAEEVEALLRCDEVLDLSPLTDYPPDAQPPESHFSDVKLDYPEVPGQNCASCAFHQAALENPEACCSLCYMRKTAYAVYGECYLHVSHF